jgi:NTE family protein
LGSGGARGWAHIGVIQALNEAGISIDLINGSSIGAVVGGGYALHVNTNKMISIAKEVVRTVNVNRFSPFRHAFESQSFLRNWLVNVICDVAAMRSHILSHRDNIKALKLLFGDHEFRDTQIPFSSIAVDLMSGEVVVINQGKLADGILPSLSVPGIFPPIRRNGQLLSDGGILANVPARELRQQGAEFVIASVLGVEVCRTYRSGLDILHCVDSFKFQRISRWQYDEADFLIRIDIPGFDSRRYDNYEIAIRHGYEVTKQALPELKRRLSRACA